MSDRIALPDFYFFFFQKQETNIYVPVVYAMELEMEMVAAEDKMSHIVRKPVFGVSEQVRHKPGCTTTENSQRFEI